MILVESDPGISARTLAAAWPWALEAVVALFAIPRTRLSFAAVLGVAGVGLAWICVFCWTGDRRLFFPYTIQLAVQSICLLDGRVRWPALLGGGTMMLLFTAIRLVQGATLSVLFVEWIVAAGVLALAVTAWRNSARSSAARLGLGLIASLLAYAGLAF